MPNDIFDLICSPLEELWGKELFGGDWEPRPTDEELALLEHFRDPNKAWEAIGSDCPDPPTPKVDWTFPGSGGKKLEADALHARKMKRRKQLARVKRQRELVDRFGKHFDPAQNVPSESDFTELKIARDVCARVEKQHRRQSLPESQIQSEQFAEQITQTASRHGSASPDSTDGQKETAERQSIKIAAEALWGKAERPKGKQVQVCDREINDYQKRHGLQVTSPKTHRRFFAKK